MINKNVCSTYTEFSDSQQDVTDLGTETCCSDLFQAKNIPLSEASKIRVW